MLVKFFRVYTYLWGTFNLGFAKMTKFDTFGHISPCRWGRRGKKLIKPEYILGQGPTKKNDQFADLCAVKLIFSRKTLGCSIDLTPEHIYFTCSLSTIRHISPFVHHFQDIYMPTVISVCCEPQSGCLPRPTPCPCSYPCSCPCPAQCTMCTF